MIVRKIPRMKSYSKNKKEKEKKKRKEKRIECLSLLLRIRRVWFSNLGPNTEYPD
jgi:hypothetical protein